MALSRPQWHSAICPSCLPTSMPVGWSDRPLGLAAECQQQLSRWLQPSCRDCCRHVPLQAGYTAAAVESEGGVRWESLQQRTAAAPPAAAAPINRTRVPATAVPVSTVAHTNNLPMYSPLPEPMLDLIWCMLPWSDRSCPSEAAACVLQLCRQIACSDRCGVSGVGATGPGARP
jgi:hypothetical protein